MPSQTSFVPDPSFDEYRERFAEHFVLERDDAGVIVARMHTHGAEAMWSLELHHAIPQLFTTIAADPENKLLIFGGTGDRWLGDQDVDSFGQIQTSPETFRRESYFKWYKDGLRLQETLVWEVDIPTIALFNGSGLHSEIALLCDLTLCADDAEMMEPHFVFGLAPGDAQFLVFQELMGTKRANYVMYRGKPVTPAEALEWGLVNEVLPRDQLLPRARELAAGILKQEDIIRRMSARLAKRRWRRLLTDDLEMHLAHEMWGVVGRGGLGS
ncbi:MAG: enoyl-CoA hydratase/isomerase family protein [Ilumatobacteraceae bacterium]